ncbi:hypothetical protein TNCV_2068621 [Trichonephila clavipes]|uniref:Uncharacterized protein n=1 Tax=Trichonephila clavipes TaxID=2585209 RepID=A0A8X7BCV9_TRICX|nr:hypothetical protein TNCV_2068621 [Trichonephila clavipes]
MKEGFIASTYECPKCDERMRLYERKSFLRNRTSHAEVSLGHQSLTPTELGRVDEELASPGGRSSQHTLTTTNFL